MLEDPPGLVEELETLALLALGEVGAVGEEDRHERDDEQPEQAAARPTGSRRRAARGSCSRPRRAPPNWIISGSFWNCGAPPDSEIAVAIATALTTVADERSRRRPRASRRASAGRPGDARRWKTDEGRPSRRDREVAEVERELQRRLAEVDEGGARPDQDRQEVLVRREQEETDDGRELAQREGVRLAPEVDVDDLELGEEEADASDGPGDVEGLGRRRQSPELRQVEQQGARRDPRVKLQTRTVTGIAASARRIGTPAAATASCANPLARPVGF